MSREYPPFPKIRQSYNCPQQKQEAHVLIAIYWNRQEMCRDLHCDGRTMSGDHGEAKTTSEGIPQPRISLQLPSISHMCCRFTMEFTLATLKGMKSTTEINMLWVLKTALRVTMKGCKHLPLLDCIVDFTCTNPQIFPSSVNIPLDL